MAEVIVRVVSVFMAAANNLCHSRPSPRVRSGLVFQFSMDGNGILLVLSIGLLYHRRRGDIVPNNRAPVKYRVMNSPGMRFFVCIVVAVAAVVVVSGVVIVVVAFCFFFSSIVAVVVIIHLMVACSNDCRFGEGIV